MSQLKNLIKEWKYKNGKYVCELHGGGASWGSYTGYVGVPKGHPIWGLHYDKVMKMIPDLFEHVQLTYSTETKQPQDGLWLVGFHASDIREVKMYPDGRRFKDFKDPGQSPVAEMTEWLAEQLETLEL